MGQGDRGYLLILNEAREPCDRKSCTPISVRKQLYISLPNQLMSFEKSVYKAKALQGTAGFKKAVESSIKKKGLLEFGVRRLDKGLEYIVDKKLPKLYKKSGKYSDKLVGENKLIIATACKFIKYVEQVVRQLSKLIGISPDSDYGSCADKYNHVLAKDPTGYTPESQPRPEFINKWLSTGKKSRFLVLKRVGYYTPDELKQRR